MKDMLEMLKKPVAKKRKAFGSSSGNGYSECERALERGYTPAAGRRAREATPSPLLPSASMYLAGAAVAYPRGCRPFGGSGEGTGKAGGGAGREDRFICFYTSVCM